MDDSSVLVSTDGGVTVTRHPTPCPAAGGPPGPDYGDRLGQLLLTDNGGLTWHTVTFWRAVCELYIRFIW